MNDDDDIDNFWWQKDRQWKVKRWEAEIFKKVGKLKLPRLPGSSPWPRFQVGKKLQKHFKFARWLLHLS